MARAFVFDWQQCVLDSGLEPTTRFVLLVLSIYVNKQDEVCFPSQATLAENAGLSERAVGIHIGKAIEAGWLVKTKRGVKGRRWKLNDYRLQFPPGFTRSSIENASKLASQRGEIASDDPNEVRDRDGDVPNEIRERPESHGSDVPNDVRTNRPVNNPMNSARAREGGPAAPLRGGGAAGPPEPEAENPLTREWGTVLGILRGHIDMETIRTWLEPLEPVALEDGVASLRAPSGFHRDWVISHYRYAIRDAWQAVRPTLDDVKIVGGENGARPAR